MLHSKTVVQELHGPWPNEVLICGARIGSSNLSLKNSQNDKHTFLIFAKHNYDWFGFKHQLRQVVGWRCFNKNKTGDICARVLGIGQ